jgi:hypothetical protein
VKISPNVQMGIAAAVAVFSAVAQGALKLPMGVPPEAAQYLISWDNFLIGAYLIASPIMLGFSSSAPGVLAPPDPKIVVAAQKLADLPGTASAPEVEAAKTAVNTAVAAH